MALLLAPDCASYLRTQAGLGILHILRMKEGFFRTMT